MNNTSPKNKYMWTIKIKNGEIISIDGKSPIWTGNVPPNRDNLYLLWWINTSPEKILVNPDTKGSGGLWIALELLPERKGIRIFDTIRVVENLFFWFEDSELYISNFPPPKKPDKKNIEKFIETGELPLWETYFEDVYQLPIASELTVTWKNGSPDVIRKMLPIDELSEDKSITSEDFAIEMRNTIERQILALSEEIVSNNVRALLALSGGLDSSAVYAILDKIARTKIPELREKIVAAVISVSDYDKINETKFAKLAARNGIIPLEIVSLESSEIWDITQSTPSLFVQPTSEFTSIAEAKLFSWAATRGFEYIITGTFGVDYALGNKYGMLLKYIKYFAKHSPRTALKLLNHIDFKNILKLYIIQRRGGNYAQNLNFKKTRYPSLHREIASKAILVETFRIRDMLAKNLGLMSKMPIDNALIRAALKMPVEEKLKNGWLKYPVRIAFEDILPREIVWRKDKSGFPVPEYDWMHKIAHENELEDILYEANSNPLKFWRILSSRMFENWCNNEIKNK